VLEGPDLVTAAVQAGAAVEAVYFDPKATAPDTTCATALSVAAAAGIRLIELAPGVLTKVAEAVTPQPVLAVCSFPDTDLLAIPRDGFVLVLADIRDPGNLGTAIRAADAAAAAGIVVCGQSADVFNPKTLRATAGSVFHLPVAVAATLGDVTTSLGATGRRFYGAVVRGGADAWMTPISNNAAVVIGSEATGLSDAQLSLLDGTITIAMEGRAESLNAGVAAALLCFESLRQRHMAAGTDGPPPTI
jgi:TrmH family RNA methyltransferase